MKKNNIKIKKDGTHTYRNENIWMHSVDRPVDENEFEKIAHGFLMIIGMGALAFILLVMLGGC